MMKVTARPDRKWDHARVLGYLVDEDGALIGAPCCCYGEDHFSHPYCQEPTPSLLQAERDGLITRSLDTGWRWIIV